MRQRIPAEHVRCVADQVDEDRARRVGKREVLAVTKQTASPRVQLEATAPGDRVCATQAIADYQIACRTRRGA